MHVLSRPHLHPVFPCQGLCLGAALNLPFLIVPLFLFSRSLPLSRVSSVLELTSRSCLAHMHPHALKANTFSLVLFLSISFSFLLSSSFFLFFLSISYFSNSPTPAVPSPSSPPSHTLVLYSFPPPPPIPYLICPNWCVKGTHRLKCHGIGQTARVFTVLLRC